MDIRVDRNLETYKCYTFLEMGKDKGYDKKVKLRINFTPKVVKVVFKKFVKREISR